MVKDKDRAFDLIAKDPRTGKVLYSNLYHRRFDCTDGLDAVMELFPDAHIVIRSDIPGLEDNDPAITVLQGSTG